MSTRKPAALIHWIRRFATLACVVAGATAAGSAPKPAERVDLYGDPLPPGAVARLGTIRHRYRHNSTQYLPDGHTILVIRKNHLRWVNADTGRTFKQRWLPSGFLWCGVSGDGRFAMVAREDAVALWDIVAWKERQKAKGLSFLRHPEDGTPVRWSSAQFNAQFSDTALGLVLMDSDGRRSIWDAKADRELWHFDHDGRLLCLGFQPNGKTLAFLDSPKSLVRVCDAFTGRELRNFTVVSPGREFGGILCSPDGRTLLSGMSYDCCRAWDIPTGHELPSVRAYNFSSFHVSMDGRTLLAETPDRQIGVWEWPSGKWKRLIDLGPDKLLQTRLISPDGTRAEIAVLDNDETWHGFDLKTGKEIPRVYAAHTGKLLALGIRPDGKLISAAADGTVRTWDLESGKQLQVQQDDTLADRTCVAFSGDGLIMAAANGRSQRFRLVSLSGAKALPKTTLRPQQLLGLTFASNTHLLTVCCMEEPDAEWKLSTWDIDRHTETSVVKSGLGGIGFISWKERLAFSRDGRLVAVPGERKTATVFDVHTGRKQELGADWVTSLAFSPDGRLLAAANNERVTVWELSSGAVRARSDDRVMGDVALCFSPDGRWLARTDASDIQILDAATCKEVTRLRGHLGDVTQLAFKPDGRRLVSGSDDTTVLVWDFESIIRPWLATHSRSH